MAHIVFAGFTGDRSGSMTSMGDSPGNGLFNWIKDQVEGSQENSQTVKLFVSTFDDKNEVRYNNKSADDIKVDDDLQTQCETWMSPRGMTKLYDSAIADLTRLMRAKADFESNMSPMLRAIDPKIVMVWACLTDGFDNSSMASVAMFRQKVEEAKAAGVKCFFLAANQDAISTGEQYGFDAACSMTIGADRQTSGNALRCLSQVTQQVAQGDANFQGFTSMMRQSSAPASFSTPPTNMASSIPTVPAFPVGPPLIGGRVGRGGFPLPPRINLRQPAV
tara:strand:- start:658 stop:1488 length:831 start_codon:yes stop_codon:yes gene_type:complete